MDDNQQGTIADVLALRAGDKQNPTYVNFAFEAIVSVGEGRPTQSGGKIYPATLTDPHNPNLKIETAFFSTPAQYHGQLVRFGGKGMTRTEYQGRAKLGLGKNTEKTLLGKVSSNPPAAQGQGSTLPLAPENAPPAMSVPPKASRSGVAVKVVELVLELFNVQAIDLEPGSEEFTKQVYTVSSDLMRVIDRLEAQHYAKGPTERAKAKAPPAAPPDQGGRTDPPPRTAPAPASDDPEQDVPF